MRGRAEKVQVLFRFLVVDYFGSPPVCPTARRFQNRAHEFPLDKVLRAGGRHIVCRIDVVVSVARGIVENLRIGKLHDARCIYVGTPQLAVVFGNVVKLARVFRAVVIWQFEHGFCFRPAAHKRRRGKTARERDTNCFCYFLHNFLLVFILFRHLLRFLQ